MNPSPRSPSDPTGTPGEVTRLLRAWRGGDSEAEAALWPILYNELKGLARSVLRGRRHSRGPQTTTLVHEAYLRLTCAEVDWNDRRHFFTIAARAMRFVLVDEVRRRSAKKRAADDAAEKLGGEAVEQLAATASPADVVLAVHEALDRLGQVNPRHVQLVELRYFAGMSLEETAEVLEVSRPTVVRDWRAVRVWLYGELSTAPP